MGSYLWNILEGMHTEQEQKQLSIGDGPYQRKGFISIKSFVLLKRNTEGQNIRTSINKQLMGGVGMAVQTRVEGIIGTCYIPTALQVLVHTSPMWKSLWKYARGTTLLRAAIHTISAARARWHYMCTRAFVYHITWQQDTSRIEIMCVL